MVEKGISVAGDGDEGDLGTHKVTSNAGVLSGAGLVMA